MAVQLQPVSTTIEVASKTSIDSSSRVLASPLAKSMAKEKGIDIGLVQGSGENGRVIKKDVEAYASNPPVATQASSIINPVKLASNIHYGDVMLSQMRKTIARRLSESKFGAPHFYLTMEINMDEMVKARKLANADAEVRISFNDIIVKSSAAALRGVFCPLR